MDESVRNVKSRAFNSSKDYANMLLDGIHETCDTSKLAGLSTRLSNLTLTGDAPGLIDTLNSCMCNYCLLIRQAKYLASPDEAKHSVDQCYRELMEYRSAYDLQAERPSKNK